MSEPGERRAAITGIGQSEIGRRLGRDPLALTLDACLAAIEDAGLTRDDIDGLSTYPGSFGAGAPGFSGAGIPDVHDALRLQLRWFDGGIEHPGQLGSVINACLAVASGLAKHVLCFRTVWESTAQGDGRRRGIGTGGGDASIRPSRSRRRGGRDDFGNRPPGTGPHNAARGRLGALREATTCPPSPWPGCRSHGMLASCFVGAYRLES